MSSGQARYEEDIRQEANEEHIKRLAEVGYAKIANITDELYDAITSIEYNISSLPRAGWNKLDRIKKLIVSLK